MPVYLLNEDIAFPVPSLARGDGLLAVGGDLSDERLLLAYSAGIFPWYTDVGPILWWSPDPRLVIKPAAFHLHRRTRRHFRRCGWQVRLDTVFDAVTAACAAPRGPDEAGTWITDDMMRAYGRLHRLGYAHSVEVWEGMALVGGLYGVAIGKGFFGESMFSRRSNASKVALAALVRFLSRHGFHFIDCQVTSTHLMQFGAEEVPRELFLEWLDRANRESGVIGRWAWSVAAAALAEQVEGGR